MQFDVIRSFHLRFNESEMGDEESTKANRQTDYRRADESEKTA
jgi:hypothetical protein